MGPCITMEWEGEEAVGEVEFAVPTVDCGRFCCLLDGGVGEVLICEMLIEISREVDDQARLLAGFDDDVEGLNAVGAWIVRREFNDGVEVHVLSQPTADNVGITKDCRGVGVFH
jgi:hypothetical protein